MTRKRTRNPASAPMRPASKPPLGPALVDAPGAAPAPSIAAATAHEVDRQRYTPKEAELAKMAMDFGGRGADALTFVEATSFPGFPTLSLLSQLSEYRSMHERLADECVRKFGRVTTTGDSDPERLKLIEAELDRINLKAHIRQAVIHDQAYGGAHVYFKLKNDDAQRELPLVLKPYTVRKSSFEGLRVVEPYWVTPNYYNSIDPTAEDFYKPSSWWMIGTQVHATRLYSMVSRPVADMLKPAYSFRGVSMTQLAMPYVDNWLRTRQSVSDAVKQFAVTGVAVDLEQNLLPGGAQSLRQRAELLNAYRDNRNLLFVDKATEEFFQITTPLTSLDALQAQAQEQMGAVSHMPLVILLGITPTGLNASSEGEIRAWYDYVLGYSNNVLTPLIKRVLQIVQLSLFGEVDEHVDWSWDPLLELTALEQAEMRNKDADTAGRYVDMTAISPEDVARKLKADEESGYAGILNNTDPDDIPDDDIAQITENLLKPVADETHGHSSPEPAEQDPGTDTGERAAGSAVPDPAGNSGQNHGSELSLVDNGGVQNRPDDES